MKKVILPFLAIVLSAFFANAGTIYVTDTIKSNTTWTSSNIYMLEGFVFVKTGYTLTIEPGTIVKGDTGKATLIVQRGAKIMAQGTATKPIVFTSGKPKGQRVRGDWGGIVLLGASQVNDYTIGTSGDTIWPAVEGFPPSIKEPIRFGGHKLDDNSGVLSYVRIEYAGVAYSQDNEINGLTFGGVGSGTTIDHVQVSFSNDDSYEWFGGTVNCKYMIAWAGTDDNWDTDDSYSGKVQFFLGKRHPKFWDVSAKGASNGCEADNITDFYSTRPFGRPFSMSRFSNVTDIGPWYGDTSTDLSSTHFNSGMLIRRNSRLSAFNSLITGWKNAIEITGGNTANALLSDSSTIKNVFYAGYKKQSKYNKLDGRDTFNIIAYLNNGSKNNKFYPKASDMMLANPYDTFAPDFRPQSGSPLLGSASFSDARVGDKFFDQVSYVGAFDGVNDWTANWAVWNPQIMDYTVAGKVTAIETDNVGFLNVGLAPNPAQDNTVLNFVSTSAQRVNVSVMNLNGQKVLDVVSNNAVVDGENKISINTASLSNGLYIIYIQGQNGVSTYKMSILK